MKEILSSIRGESDGHSFGQDRIKKKCNGLVGRVKGDQILERSLQRNFSGSLTELLPPEVKRQRRHFRLSFLHQPIRNGVISPALQLA